MTGRRYKNDDVARRDAFPWTSSQGSPKVAWMKSSGRLEPGQNSLTVSADLQAGDTGSLFSHYRRLSALRAASVAARRGGFAQAEWSGFRGATVLAWLREDPAERLLVVHNLDTLTAFIATVPEGIALAPLWTSGRGVLPDEERSIALGPASRLELGAGESAAFVVK